MIETRAITYPHRDKAYHRKIDGRTRVVDDPGGVGTAITREVAVCPWCARPGGRG